jgi:hypothetical protein
MRAVAVVCLVVALAGCRSSRDYRSLNRTSTAFLFETFREGNQLRKKNLKQDVAFSQRAPQNRMLRKTSREFAWESFWIEEWSGWSEIAHAREVEKKPMSERMRSVRFGFLDTGD